MSQEKNTILNEIISQNPADIYIYTGTIDKNIQVLRDLICKHPEKKEQVDLFIATYGGDPDWAYRLVSTLRTYYTRINVIIPGACKSAGTLIAFGADTLRFHEYGELGPLDVQIRRKDNLLGFNSGLDVFQALSIINNSAGECFHKMFLEFLLKGGGSISTETAATIAKDLSVGIYSSIASKIDPVELGEKNRAMGIAEAYGKQLCYLSKHANAKPDTLVKLISCYPSHGFVIDMEQSKKLFYHVEKMTPNDYKVCSIFKEAIDNPNIITTIDFKDLYPASPISIEESHNDTEKADLPQKAINKKRVNPKRGNG